MSVVWWPRSVHDIRIICVVTWQSCRIVRMIKLIILWHSSVSKLDYRMVGTNVSRSFSSLFLLPTAHLEEIEFFGETFVSLSGLLSVCKRAEMKFSMWRHRRKKQFPSTWKIYPLGKWNNHNLRLLRLWDKKFCLDFAVISAGMHYFPTLLILRNISPTSFPCVLMASWTFTSKTRLNAEKHYGTCLEIKYFPHVFNLNFVCRQHEQVEQNNKKNSENSRAARLRLDTHIYFAFTWWKVDLKN